MAVVTEHAMNPAANSGRHGPRYVGAASKRWPDGRPLCGGDRGTDSETGEHRGYCRKTAGSKTDHFGFGGCDNHAGCTPNGRASAQVAQVEAAIASMPRPVRRVGNVLETFDAYAGEVLGWYELAAEKARALEAWTVGENAIPRGELTVLKGFMAECRQTLDAVGRLNIDERLSQVSKRHGQQFAVAFAAGIAVLGLSPEQQARVPDAVEAGVRALGAPVIEGRAA